MSTQPFGLGAGLFEGLANSYASGQRMWLENEMAQRKNVWDTLSAALPNARPEAQVKLFQKMAGLASTPLHKKLDKSVTDFSDIIEAPPGYGANASAPSSGVTPGTMQSSVGAAPESTAFAPAALHGGGMPAVPGVGGGGPSSGASRIPSDIQPPPVVSSIGEGGGVGMGQLPGAQAPAYSPWYSPDEQSQILANRGAMESAQKVHQEITARRAEGEDLIRQGRLQPGDLARYSLGQAPYIVRFQQKLIQDPDDPNKNIMADFDSITGQTYRPGTSEVIADPKQPAESKLGDVVPDKDSPTGWSRKIYERDGSVGRLEKGAAPPAGYAPTYGESSGQNISTDPATGRQVVTPFTRSSVTQRGVPGQEPPKLAPPPTSAGAPQAGAIVRTPKTVEDAGKGVTTAEQRLSMMQKQEKSAKAGNQQAQIAILAAHMGMTGGIVPGVRIGAQFWKEAEESAPWWDRVIAPFTRVDPNTGEHYFTADALSGIKLTPEQVDQMVGLATDGVEVAKKSFDATKKQAASGYGYGPGSGTAKKSATKAHIQAYATKFHLTYQQAEDEFVKDGVTVEGR